MADSPFSIDDLLAQQESPDRLEVTVEAIEGDTERVKVTPFVSGVGCPCSRALKIPKTAIAAVEPTGEQHVCCGKRLVVVAITFNDAVYTDVLEQVRASIAAPEHSESSGPSREDVAALLQQLGPALSGAAPSPSLSQPSFAQSPFGRPANPWQRPVLAPEWSGSKSTGNYSADVAWCWLQKAICLLSCGLDTEGIPEEWRARCVCQCENARLRCEDPTNPINPC